MLKTYIIGRRLLEASMKHDTDKIGLTGKIGNLVNQLKTTVK